MQPNIQAQEKATLGKVLYTFMTSDDLNSIWHKILTCAECQEWLSFFVTNQIFRNLLLDSMAKSGGVKATVLTEEFVGV